MEAEQLCATVLEECYQTTEVYRNNTPTSYSVAYSKGQPPAEIRPFKQSMPFRSIAATNLIGGRKDFADGLWSVRNSNRLDVAVY